MKIRSLSIKNVASYREATTFHFDSRLNILIGPNGGGKSNAQRILTVLLTKYFLPHWTFERHDNRKSTIRVAESWEPERISSSLERHAEDDSDQELTIVIEPELSDLENMRMILRHKSTLAAAAKAWNDPAIRMLEEPEIEEIAAQGPFTYSFVNCHPRPPQSTAAGNYLTYLHHFFKIARYAESNRDIVLRSPIFFFASSRQTGSNFSTAINQLTEHEYFGQYRSVYAAATGGTTNLIEFSTRHFARLMWQATLKAAETAGLVADDIFAEEDDVVLATTYLQKLGYSWRLVASDRERMNFQLEFYKNGKNLVPNRFSSGEREIFHFLFAAFALNVEHGVIIIDEPELHLHPRWQRIFLDLFYDLSDSRQNQFILATHSPQFVTPRTIGNITRVFERSGSSRRASLKSAELPNKQHIVRIVNSHNNERLFFADQVVLVEGISDRLIFASLIEAHCRKRAINRTIEVIEVGGKQGFDDYVEVCRGVDLPTAIIADLDYLRECGIDAVRDLFASDAGKIWENVTGKKSRDSIALCNTLETAIASRDLNRLQSLWQYILNRGTRLKSPLTSSEQALLDANILQLRSERIYVLRRGEIEEYLPLGKRDIAGIVELVREPDWHLKLENELAAAELDEIVCDVLELDVGVQEDSRSATRGTGD